MSYSGGQAAAVPAIPTITSRRRIASPSTGTRHIKNRKSRLERMNAYGSALSLESRKAIFEVTEKYLRWGSFDHNAIPLSFSCERVERVKAQIVGLLDELVDGAMNASRRHTEPILKAADKTAEAEKIKMAEAEKIKDQIADAYWYADHLLEENRTSPLPEAPQRHFVFGSRLLRPHPTADYGIRPWLAEMVELGCLG